MVGCMRAYGRLQKRLEILLVGDYFREDDFNYAFHYFGPTVVPEALLPGPLTLGGQTIFDYYAARGEQAVDDCGFGLALVPGPSCCACSMMDDEAAREAAVRMLWSLAHVGIPM